MSDPQAPYHQAMPMRDLWNRLARENPVSAIRYHATPEWFEEAGRRDAAYLLGLVPRPAAEATVLDIGGGIGRVAKYLAPQVRRYYLLDVSEEMLCRARERMPVMTQGGKVIAVLGEGQSLSGIPDSDVDFAFSHMVFQHIDREVVLLYLLDLARVLSPRGVAWLQVPAMRYPERFEDAARGDWPANFRRWHPGEFLEVCVRCGLSVLAADCDGMEVLVAKAPEIRWMGGSGCADGSVGGGGDAPAGESCSSRNPADGGS